MRTLKRFLIFVRVIVAGMLGLMLPPLGADFVYRLLGQDTAFALAAYCSGLILAIAGFVYLFRKSRAWEFELDVADYAVERMERRLHPRRAKYRRVLGQTLVWVPCLIAAFVLVYAPEISHVPHLGSRYLKHYRIPIPLNITVLSFSGEGPNGYGVVEALVRNTNRRRHGGLYFWESDVTSVLTFGNLGDEQAVKREHPAPFGAPVVLLRDFRFGDVVLACRQYAYPAQPDRPYVSCQTSADVRKYNLIARFEGKAGDLPIFYSILSGITKLT